MFITPSLSLRPIARSLQLIRSAGSSPLPGLALVMLLGAGLSACSLLTPQDLQPPAPMQLPKDLGADDSQGQLAQEEMGEPEKPARFSRGPTVKPTQGTAIRPAPDQLFPEDGVEDILLNVSNLPLSAFINEVFGNILGLDFQIDPQISEKNDLVTVRISSPRNKAYVYQLGREILNSYGVNLVRSDEYLRFVIGRGTASEEPPLLLTGAALPNVPESHRPVVYIRSLEAISPADAYAMLRSIFSEQRELIIERENRINAVRLQGPSSAVQQASEVLNSLDQPLLRGANVLRINPEFTPAKDMAERLTQTLGAQGYDIGTSGNNIQLVAIDNLGALFVFAPSQELLGIVRRWAQELDQVPPASATGETNVYWYAVKNTPAQELAQTLNSILSGGAGPGLSESADDRRLQGRSDEQAGSQGNSTATAAVRSNITSQGSFVVNEARNMLLFRGAPGEWQRMLPLIRELDVAPDQVLVEVIVAEVTLTDTFSFGVEWALNEISAAGAKGAVSNVFGDGAPGSGLGAGGLVWTSISGSGNTRIALNAFASSNQVNILQTPRILVRSGESASVTVGNEVPIISRQSTGSDTVDGNSSILQEIQFRKTGVQLTVLPRVYSDGRIDLEIQQEVSQAQPNTTSNIDSPMILTRNVDTRLSLQDGGSVLLGGLISTNQSKGDSRTPWLGDLPVLGHLFRMDNTNAERTELMVMVVPYRVRNSDQAEAISSAFRDQLRLLNQDNTQQYPLYKGAIQR